LIGFCLLPGLAAAQTVELSSRTFWLGEQPSTLESYPPFIAPGRIPWIAEILETDAVLRHAVIHIDATFISAAQSVAGPNAREVLLDPDRLPPEFDLPGYREYGPPDPTATSITYVPDNPDAGFIVWCDQNRERSAISFCAVNATYPPDDRIRLKARLYHPSNLMGRPDRFRDIAERMRDLAYCLDVTDDSVDVPKARPTLSGCRPDITS
jgi:hypothetical protein